MSSSKSSSSFNRGNTASSKPTEEKRFKDAYSKALAKALLDNEEQLRQSKSQHKQMNVTSLEEVENVYKDLCFDYPLTPQFGETFALALLFVRNHFQFSNSNGNGNDEDNDYLKSLLVQCPPLSGAKSGRQCLALSNRFVDGVIETSTKTISSRNTAIHQAASTGASNKNKNASTSTNGKKNDESGGDDDDYLESYESYLKQPIVKNKGTSNSDKDDSINNKGHYSNIQGCHLLSFVLFAFGPLQCIQKLKEVSSKSSQVEKLKLMNSVQSFLGSYDATTAANVESNKNVNYNATATEDLLSSMNEMNILRSGTNTTSDSSYDKSLAHDNDNDNDDKNKSDLESDDNSKDYNDDDPLEEIWAEESDPDDYDYGNDRYANTPSATTTTATSAGSNYTSVESSSFALVDPLVLSKKQKNRTIQDTVQCLHSLLNELSYAKLSHLSRSCTLWKEWNVTQVLYDLTLTLLQFSKQQQDFEDEDNNKDKDDNVENIIAQNLSMLYMKPLMVLRDRALDDFTSGNSSGLEDYTKLLHILLESDEKIVGQFASQNIHNQQELLLSTGQEEKQLSPSRIIGLSSIAALCTSIGDSDNSLTMSTGATTEKKRKMKDLYQKVQSILLNAIDELVDCIEFIRPRATKATMTKNSIVAPLSSSIDVDDVRTVPAWARVSLSLLPILDFLTGIKSHSDFSYVISFISSQSEQQQQQYGLKTSDAQAILQSGLFRELLLLYSSTVKSPTVIDKKSKSDVLSSAEEIIRLKLLRAILVISAQASSTLGKYAARVPDFTRILHSESFITHHLPDCALWFALLSSLSSVRSGVSQLRMKSSTPSSTNYLSPVELKNRCVSCSVQLCENVIFALEQLSKSKDPTLGENNRSEMNGNKTGYEQSHLDAINEFNIFSSCLNQVHVLAQCWVNTISNQKSTVQGSLSKVLKSLMKNQKIIASHELVSVSGSNIKDNKKGMLKMKKSNFAIFGDKIRCSAKFLLLTIDNATYNKGNDAACGMMSSKND